MWNVDWLLRTLWTLFVIVGAAGCQGAQVTALSMMLTPDAPVLVSFPLTVTSQSYRFNSNPYSPTYLLLSTLTPAMHYTVEVRDGGGAVFATLSGGSLQSTTLTIAPGDETYEVAVRSEQSTTGGLLSVMVSSSQSSIPAATLSNPTPQAIAVAAVAQPLTNTAMSCQASSAVAGSVNVRSGPSLDYAVIGGLSVGQTLPVIGHNVNGWYPVQIGEQTGWVSGSVVTVSGVCDGLPDVALPAVAGGPLRLDVDRDGWAMVSDALASSDADPRDLVLMAVSHLVAGTPDDYREFNLTLVCTGTGTEGVRWGAPERPSLSCGSSIVVPATAAFNQQWIAVTLADRSLLSQVSYTLTAARRS